MEAPNHVQETEQQQEQQITQKSQFFSMAYSYVSANLSKMNEPVIKDQANEFVRSKWKPLKEYADAEHTVSETLLHIVFIYALIWALNQVVQLVFIVTRIAFFVFALYKLFGFRNKFIKKQPQTSIDSQSLSDDPNVSILKKSPRKST